MLDTPEIINQDGVRIFGHDTIRDSVDRALGTLAPEDRYAFVATGFKAKGSNEFITRMAFMVKLSKNGKWSVGGFTEGNVTKNPFQVYGAEIRFSG